ncbi:DUF389 domain-containing protein [Sphingomonas sp.]|uniref:DUF389 domain-containing protein n=1 Tax=Sphingomonas sp. TaxID=28214 RepID=UPI002D7F10F6|nr:DUF389 domain-containing protein [Sphingomonas sp.]
MTGGVDHDAILHQIADESGWSGRYAFLILVSAAISLLGLLMPSVAVLIGAMLLSPLMMPIIGLGFGIATLDFHEIRRSLTALLAGSAIAILLSVVMVSISPVQTITSEIAGRTQPTLFDLLVALLSAIAGAYALIRGRGGTVVGVAIAIALMPPLAVVGFGIATWNWTIFAGSSLLFLTNAVTIALTAALVARVYGFGGHLSPAHTGWQLALFVVAVGLLSVPLAASLHQIAFEAVAQRQVRDMIRKRFPEGARLGQVDIDYAAHPIRIRAVMLTPRLDAAADRILAGNLRQRLARDVDIHVDQVRISQDAGAAEAAQIARAVESGAANRPDARDTAINQFALLIGAAPATISADTSRHTLTGSAAALPGLEMAGYRAIEDRARRAIPDWTARVVPPADVDPPAVSFDEGVVDDAALGLAAWASDRVGREISVRGGTAAQRRAVAAGIAARGGRAEAGSAAGALRLAWVELPPPETGATPELP